MAIGRLIATAGLVFAMAAPALTPASAQQTTAPQTANATTGLTIVLEHVPAETDGDIYVVGSFNPKGDNTPEYRLIQDGHGRYTLTLPASVRGPIAFKFMLGSPQTMEVDATGAQIPFRRFTVPETGAATYTANIAAWPPHTPWRNAAATDLTSIHDFLRDNAPQMFVERDSAHFRKWLETGYAEAQAKLPKVQDQNGYIHLLRGYAGGFRDAHLQVSGRPKFRRWPGFAMAWADGAYLVRTRSAAVTDKLPPIGAKLLGCDGKSAEDIARSHIDRYHGNLDLYSGRVLSASFLLWDANPFVEPLKTCRFKGPSAVEEYPLSYRPIDREVKFPQSPRARFGLTQAAPKVWRIGIPIMHPELDWPQLYADIEAHLEDIRNGTRLIIDLRGNGGGNSGYTSQLAKRLWGQAATDHYAPFGYQFLYPATPLMRQRMADTLTDLRKQNHEGKDSSADVRMVENLLADLDKAVAEGRKTVTIEMQTPPARGKPPANPMKAQVFLVTDYACFSSCLDLMDRMLAIPNVYHAGTQTGADTIFNEVRTHQLPSGQAKLTYGHKAFINRPRGSNVPYTPTPALTYHGDLTDEAAFERWLAAIPVQKSR